MRKHLKNYFVPHVGNDYKPPSLQKKAMLGMVSLVLLSFAITNLQSVIWTNSNWLVSSVLPAVLIDLTNQARVDNSLGRLQESAVLDAAAQLKAEDMARYEYFAHYSPTGVSPWYWFNQVNYNFINAGENLAINFTDSEDVVRAWLASPSHRANIMKGEYTETGIGAVTGTYQGFTTVYVVQFFGTPANPRPSVAKTSTQQPTPAVLAETATKKPEVIENKVTLDKKSTNLDTQIAGSEKSINSNADTEISLSSTREPVTVAKDSVGSLNEVLRAIAATDTPSNDATDTQITNIEVNNKSVVLSSNEISTTTGGIPATVNPNQQIKNNNSSAKVLGVVTKPQLVLQILYLIIGLFVLVSLILSIIIEIKKQHPMQIAYGSGLLAIMILLLYVHMMLTSGAVIL